MLFDAHRACASIPPQGPLDPPRDRRRAPGCGTGKRAVPSCAMTHRHRDANRRFRPGKQPLTTGGAAHTTPVFFRSCWAARRTSQRR